MYNDNEDEPLAVVNRCLESSKPMMENCYKTCHHAYGPEGEDPDYHAHKKCHQQCSNNIYAMSVTCARHDPKKDKNLLDVCLEKYHCGQHPLYDRECIEKYRDDILKCCQNSCISCDIDCGKELEKIIKYGNTSLIDTMKRYNLKKADFKDRTRLLWFYIALAVVVSIVIVFLVYR